MTYLKLHINYQSKGLSKYPLTFLFRYVLYLQQQ